MSRLPFQPPTGCPPVGVDPGVLPSMLSDMLFCSQPDVFSAVEAIPPAYAESFTIGGPQECQCMTFDVSCVTNLSSFRLESEGWDGRLEGRGPKWGQWGISAKISKCTVDCCDGQYKVDLKFDLPCMPLSVDSIATINIREDMTDHSVAAHFSVIKYPSCYFHYTLGLDIPCMPFTAYCDAPVVAINNAIQAPSMVVSLNREATCGLHMNVALDIPCMPLSVTGSGTGTLVDIASPDVAVVFQHKPGVTCALTFDLDMQLPCVPFTPASRPGVATITPLASDANPYVNFAVGLKKDGCEVYPSYALDIGLPANGSNPEGVYFQVLTDVRIENGYMIKVWKTVRILEEIEETELTETIAQIEVCDTTA